jgi:hypothetical protein
LLIVSHFRKKILASVFVLVLGAASAGGASAHSFSAAPVHVSSHNSLHGYGAHGGHSFWGGFFRALFGIEDEPVVVVQPVGYAPGGAAMPCGYEADFAATRVEAAAPILSDEARYRAATGLALPPHHGLVVVPPATSRGDVTWIWSNAEAN